MKRSAETLDADGEEAGGEKADKSEPPRKRLLIRAKKEQTQQDHKLIQTLARRISTLEEENRRREQTIEELSVKLLQQEAAYSTLMEQQSELAQKERKARHGAIREQELYKRTLDKLTSAENGIAGRDKQIASLRGKVRNYEQQVDGLRGKVDAFRDTIKILEQRLKDQDALTAPPSLPPPLPNHATIPVCNGFFGSILPRPSPFSCGNAKR